MSSKNSFNLLFEVPIKEEKPKASKPVLAPSSKGVSKATPTNGGAILNPVQKEKKNYNFQHHGPRAQGGVPRGREFDRHPGTAHYYENKKNGTGKYNWDNEKKPIIDANSLPKEVDKIGSNVVVINDNEQTTSQVKSKDKNSTATTTTTNNSKSNKNNNNNANNNANASSSIPNTPPAPVSEVVNQETVEVKTYDTYLQEQAQKQQEIDGIIPLPVSRKVQNKIEDNTVTEEQKPAVEVKKGNGKRVIVDVGFFTSSYRSNNYNDNHKGAGDRKGRFKNKTGTPGNKGENGGKPKDLSSSERDFPLLGK